MIQWLLPTLGIGAILTAILPHDNDGIEIGTWTGIEQKYTDGERTGFLSTSGSVSKMVNLTAERSISLWVRADGITWDSDLVSTSDGWKISLTSSHTITISIMNSIAATYSLDVIDYNWHHVSVVQSVPYVINGVGLFLYLDGHLYDPISVSSNVLYTELGYYNITLSTLSSEIILSEVHVYSGSLSKFDIGALAVDKVVTDENLDFTSCDYYSPGDWHFMHTFEEMIPTVVNSCSKLCNGFPSFGIKQRYYYNTLLGHTNSRNTDCFCGNVGGDYKVLTSECEYFSSGVRIGYVGNDKHIAVYSNDNSEDELNICTKSGYNWKYPPPEFSISVGSYVRREPGQFGCLFSADISDGSGIQQPSEGSIILLNFGVPGKISFWFRTDPLGWSQSNSSLFSITGFGSLLISDDYLLSWEGTPTYPGLVIQPNRWYHLTFIAPRLPGQLDNNEIQIFVDGFLVLRSDSWGTVSRSGSLFFGSDSATVTSVFKGTIHTIVVSRFPSSPGSVLLSLPREWCQYGYDDIGVYEQHANSVGGSKFHHKGVVGCRLSAGSHAVAPTQFAPTKTLEFELIFMSPEVCSRSQPFVVNETVRVPIISLSSHLIFFEELRSFDSHYVSINFWSSDMSVTLQSVPIHCSDGIFNSETRIRTRLTSTDIQVYVNDSRYLDEADLVISGINNSIVPILGTPDRDRLTTWNRPASVSTSLIFNLTMMPQLNDHINYITSACEGSLHLGGNRGGCRFDSVSDCIFNYQHTQRPDDFTISGWIQLFPDERSKFQCNSHLKDYSSPRGALFGWFNRQTGDSAALTISNIISWRESKGGRTYTVTPKYWRKYRICDGRWRHIAVVLSSSRTPRVIMYINGLAVVTDTVESDVDITKIDSQPTGYEYSSIGCSDNSQLTSLKGFLTNIKIVSRILSPGDILSSASTSTSSDRSQILKACSGLNQIKLPHRHYETDVTYFGSIRYSKSIALAMPRVCRVMGGGIILNQLSSFDQPSALSLSYWSLYADDSACSGHTSPVLKLTYSDQRVLNFNIDKSLSETTASDVTPSIVTLKSCENSPCVNTTGGVSNELLTGTCVLYYPPCSNNAFDFRSDNTYARVTYLGNTTVILSLHINDKSCTGSSLITKIILECGVCHYSYGIELKDIDYTPCKEYLVRSEEPDMDIKPKSVVCHRSWQHNTIVLTPYRSDIHIYENGLRVATSNQAANASDSIYLPPVEKIQLLGSGNFFIADITVDQGPLTQSEILKKSHIKISWKYISLEYQGISGSPQGIELEGISFEGCKRICLQTAGCTALQYPMEYRSRGCRVVVDDVSGLVSYFVKSKSIDRKYAVDWFIPTSVIPKVVALHVCSEGIAIDRSDSRNDFYSKFETIQTKDDSCTFTPDSASYLLSENSDISILPLAFSISFWIRTGSTSCQESNGEILNWVDGYKISLSKTGEVVFTTIDHLGNEQTNTVPIPLCGDNSKMFRHVSITDQRTSNNIFYREILIDSTLVDTHVGGYRWVHTSEFRIGKGLDGQIRDLIITSAPLSLSEAANTAQIPPVVFEGCAYPLICSSMMTVGDRRIRPVPLFISLYMRRYSDSVTNASLPLIQWVNNKGSIHHTTTLSYNPFTSIIEFVDGSTRVQSSAIPYLNDGGWHLVSVGTKDVNSGRATIEITIDGALNKTEISTGLFSTSTNSIPDVLTVGGGTPDIEMLCPTNWTRCGLSCISLSTLKVTFSTASDDSFCGGSYTESNQPSRLFEPRDDLDMNCVMKSFIEIGLSNPFWIGITSSASLRKWKYSSDDKPVDYFPNVVPIYENDKCLTALSGEFKPRNCNEKNFAICQIPPLKTDISRELELSNILVSTSAMDSQQQLFVSSEMEIEIDSSVTQTFVQNGSRLCSISTIQHADENNIIQLLQSSYYTTDHIKTWVTGIGINECQVFLESIQIGKIISFSGYVSTDGQEKGILSIDKKLLPTPDEDDRDYTLLFGNYQTSSNFTARIVAYPHPSGIVIHQGLETILKFSNVIGLVRLAKPLGDGITVTATRQYSDCQKSETSAVINSKLQAKFSSPPRSGGIFYLCFQIHGSGSTVIPTKLKVELPGDCSNNGIYQLNTTNTCTCYQDGLHGYWTGACDTCSPGYFGRLCTTRCSASHCSYRGTCTEGGDCRCHFGYIGRRCEKQLSCSDIHKAISTDRMSENSKSSERYRLHASTTDDKAVNNLQLFGNITQLSDGTILVPGGAVIRTDVGFNSSGGTISFWYKITETTLPRNNKSSDITVMCAASEENLQFCIRTVEGQIRLDLYGSSTGAVSLSSGVIAPWLQDDEKGVGRWNNIAVSYSTSTSGIVLFTNGKQSVLMPGNYSISVTTVSLYGFGNGVVFKDLRLHQMTASLVDVISMYETGITMTTVSGCPGKCNQHDSSTNKIPISNINLLGNSSMSKSSDTLSLGGVRYGETGRIVSQESFSLTLKFRTSSPSGCLYSAQPKDSRSEIPSDFTWRLPYWRVNNTGNAFISSQQDTSTMETLYHSISLFVGHSSSSSVTLFKRGGVTLFFDLASGSIKWKANSDGTITVAAGSNSWLGYHIAVVVDSTVAYLYVNGISSGSLSITTSFIDNAPMFVGESGVDVSITEFRMYDYPLSSDAVRSLARSGQKTATLPFTELCFESDVLVGSVRGLHQIRRTSSSVFENTMSSNDKQLSDGGWHHAAHIYSSLGQFLFVDGVLISSSPPSKPISATSTLLLGVGSVVPLSTSSGVVPSQYFFDGELSDIYLFSRPLSHEEVLLLNNTDYISNTVSDSLNFLKPTTVELGIGLRVRKYP